MSSETSDTSYQFLMYDGNATTIQGSFDVSGGFTDELMLGIAAAFNGLEWPAGSGWSIAKAVADITGYVPDFTQDPPVFS